MMKRKNQNRIFMASIGFMFYVKQLSFMFNLTPYKFTVMIYIKNIKFNFSNIRFLDQKDRPLNLLRETTLLSNFLAFPVDQ